MEIVFRTTKLQKEFSSSKSLVQNYGAKRAARLMQRITELRAAVSLEELRDLPAAHCHQLGQNRLGQIAVNLDQPFRLIVKPTHSPIPVKSDGGLDWSQVTSIEILEVVNYHE